MAAGEAGTAKRGGRPAPGTAEASTSVALVRLERPGAVEALVDLAEKAEGFARAARSANTLRAYAADWRDFTAWCERHGVASLPAAPAAVALYVADLAARVRASTLTRRLSAISQAHRLAGLESPTRDARVRSVVAGARRTLGTAKEGRTPVSVEDLRQMSRALPEGLLGARDRAMLLLGFAGALRRSELVALEHRDVEVKREGLVVTIRRSKTDQEGAGRKVGLPYGSHPETCPVRAYLAWLDQSGIRSGPVFRHVDRWGRLSSRRLTDRAVALVVKRAARGAGLDPRRLAGHSLRSGFCTAAAAAGVDERSIMAQSGHRSIVVMRGYIRSGSLFRENAAARIGL